MGTVFIVFQGMYEDVATCGVFTSLEAAKASCPGQVWSKNDYWPKDEPKDPAWAVNIWVNEKDLGQFIAIEEYNILDETYLKQDTPDA